MRMQFAAAEYIYKNVEKITYGDLILIVSRGIAVNVPHHSKLHAYMLIHFLRLIRAAHNQQ